MKVQEEQSSLGVVVTIVCLLALGAVGYLGYQNRERIFPSKKATPAPALKLSEETEQRFFEARDAIVAGKYGDAAKILTEIDTDKVPQPARNWMTMQHGLALFLDGKLPEARAQFEKIEKRGFFTKDPRQEKLATFFLRLSKLAASEEPVKVDVEREFDADSVEAFAFIVAGAKNWLLGAYEDSAYFFRAFKATDPPGNEIWLRRYQRIGDAYAESYAAYSIATDAAKDAGSHERKESALKTIVDAKAKIKNQPQLLAKLTEIEGELKKQVDAANAEMAKATAMSDAADKQVLDDVKARVAQFNEKYNFGDAHQIVFTAPTPGSDKGKAELDQWFKRTQWLSKFKLSLISDLNGGGFAKPLDKKDGTKVTGVTGADDNELKTAAKTTVQWPELTPDAVALIAKEFLAKATGDDAVDRKWLLGNYLYQLGRRPEALALLREAGEAKPDYKTALPLFPEDGVK